MATRAYTIQDVLNVLEQQILTAATASTLFGQQVGQAVSATERLRIAEVAWSVRLS